MLRSSKEASAGQDGTVRLWDLEGRQERQTLAGGAAWVEHLAWHPTEKRNKEAQM